MSHLKKIFTGQGGEGYIDVAVLVLCVILVLTLSIEILPVLIAKRQLDTSVTELYREAKIAGRIGSETNRRAAILRKRIGPDPEIHWSTSGRVRLSGEVTVRLTCRYSLGLLGGFGFFPITLCAAAIGKSEVYWE